MSSKRVELNKRCFFVLSGLSNPLGRVLAVEMCRRFQPGSVVLLLDPSTRALQEARKDLAFLRNNGIEVICAIADVQQQPVEARQQYERILADALNSCSATATPYELLFILHNEGMAATNMLMEPQEPSAWEAHVRQHLYAAVALNQAFMAAASNPAVASPAAQKLIVNVTASIPVRPFVHSGLFGSCQKARNMYFRAMAAEEGRNGFAVLSYSPGLLDTHQPTIDVNNNRIDLLDLPVDEGLLKLPRVRPLESTLKLINILEELSFISGHDVDYYDTYFL